MMPARKVNANSVGLPGWTEANAAAVIKYLQGWVSNQDGQAAVKQPLKRELLHDGPHRIENEQNQYAWLQDPPTLHDRDSDQSCRREQGTNAYRQQSGGDVVTTESQIAPGVRAADQEIGQIGRQRHASRQIRPTFRDLEILEKEVEDSHAENNSDIGLGDVPGQGRGRVRECGWAPPQS